MSNSKLLDQVIVDAKALRESATKSAHSNLVEKFAPQVKEAIEKLLEAEFDEENPEEQPADAPLNSDQPSPEDALAGVADPTTDFGGTDQISIGAGKVAGTANELPMAATDGEKLCPCPDDDEEVEIELDLGDLAARLSDEDGTFEDDSISPGVEGQPNKSMAAGIQESEEVSEVSLEEVFDESDSKEESLQEIKKTSKQTMKPIVEISNKKTKQLMEASTNLLTEHQSLLKEVEQKDAQIRKLLGENKKFESILKETSGALRKLEEVNVTNARLFYSNQVLKSTSLNERQRKNIVDAISKADSVNEAKSVYEMLLNSMGGNVQETKTPKSLNEVVSKNSVYRLPHKQVTTQRNPEKDRWKQLAGIKD